MTADDQPSYHFESYMAGWKLGETREGRNMSKIGSLGWQLTNVLHQHGIHGEIREIHGGPDRLTITTVDGESRVLSLHEWSSDTGMAVDITE